MSRAKLVNGVKHANRCACPRCDPGNTAMLKARADARSRAVTARAAVLSAAVAPLPHTADRPRRVLLAPFESEKTRRFRQLLREGVSSKTAAEIIESELKEITP